MKSRFVLSAVIYWHVNLGNVNKCRPQQRIEMFYCKYLHFVRIS